MDYEKIYKSFIKDRKNKSVDGYSEKHHIIPRSFGGSDDSSNIVKLTARDHYFAHCCLAKIHGGEMWSALHLMAHTQKACHGAKTFLMGRMFELSRVKSAMVRSENMKTAWKSGSFKRNRIYGPSSEAQKLAASKASKERVRTEDEKKKAIATRQLTAAKFDFINVETNIEFHGTSLEFRVFSGLSQSFVSRLTRGKSIFAKGWSIKGNENLPRGNRDHTVRIFKHRDGRIFEGTSYEFNKTHINDSGMLSNCVNGKNGVKSARGWTYVGKKEKAA